MIRGGTRPIAALIAVILAASALAACGSDSDVDTSTTTQSSSKEGSSSAGADGSQGSAASESAGVGGSQGSVASDDSQDTGSTGSHGGKAPSVETAPLEVSGGGSAQFRDEGGDNSVQEFGEEAEESELEEAAEAVHGYLVARAEEDWAAACSHLSTALVKHLESFASRAMQLAGKGCSDVLESWTPPLPAELREESTIVDAGSLRVEGDEAFLIYRGASEGVYAMSMRPEDGSWKVESLAAMKLS